MGSVYRDERIANDITVMKKGEEYERIDRICDNHDPFAGVFDYI